MEKVIALTQNVPVKVLDFNNARRGFKVQNLDGSVSVFVRANRTPATSLVAGVWTIQLSAAPTAGTFKIKIGNLTTAAIAAGANNATVQTAIQLLSGLGSVTVGNPDAGVGYKLTLTGAPIPSKVSVVDSTLKVAGVAAEQGLSLGVVESPTTGTFSIFYDQLVGKVSQRKELNGLAYDISAANLQAALRKLLSDDALTITGSDLLGGFVVTHGSVGPRSLFGMRADGTGKVFITEIQAVTPSAEPVSGTFKLAYGDQETVELNYDDDANIIQTALQALEGLEEVLVDGDFSSELTVEFIGVNDPELLTVVDNTLDDGVDPVDLVVSVQQQGGIETDVIFELGNNIVAGVADVAVTATTTENTAADTTSLSTTVAAGATLDQSSSENKQAVFVLCTHAAGASIKVTEV